MPGFFDRVGFALRGLPQRALDLMGLVQRRFDAIDDGLPALMKVPQHKAMGYTVVVIICAVVLFIVIGLMVAQLGGGPVIEA